jgi:hypothetical protein
LVRVERFWRKPVTGANEPHTALEIGLAYEAVLRRMPLPECATMKKDQTRRILFQFVGQVDVQRMKNARAVGEVCKMLKVLL